MKVLVIEDNERLAERIQYRLGKKFIIDVASNGDEALSQTASIEYSVIVLDLGLPDMPGGEVCRRLRENLVQTPILVLPGNMDPQTKIELLDSGADDYLTKPFEVDELRARIVALSRRPKTSVSRKLIRVGEIEMDVDRRAVRRLGQTIVLRRKEFDILEYLLSNAGRVLTRDMILNHAWEVNKSGWKSTVDVHIKHLRDKIDKPFGEQMIKTCYGVGYTVDAT